MGNQEEEIQAAPKRIRDMFNFFGALAAAVKESGVHYGLTNLACGRR